MEKNLKQLPRTLSSGVLKIALFGPESTGKTTLSKQLAEHFKTAWVPEYAREYLQHKWDKTGALCSLDDMLPIAIGQTKLENESVSKANNFLFCDTNLMVTKVFSEVYYDTCDPLLDQAALEHEYDLFFLTDIDVPWEKDDIRDHPNGRTSMFEIFKQTLIKNKKPFITLSGNQEIRLKNAVKIIKELALALDLGLTSNDFVQIHATGSTVDAIKHQLDFFKNGIPKINLVRPATLADGILKLSEIEIKNKALFFDDIKDQLQLCKFVPASGAASRMFKFLSEFLAEINIENESINAYINRKKATELSIFIVGMDKLPFFEVIDTQLRNEMPGFDTLDRNLKNYYFIKKLLVSSEFNFANKPKGVLPFHKHISHISTPIEDHLQECALYGSASKMANIHFTVSNAHQDYFNTIVDDVRPTIEKEYGIVINVSYSYQNKATDTLAVQLNNTPFRDSSGQLVFRPGGHGALLENLNSIDADVIFVKNIDNVVQNNASKIAFYKKALAGVLLELQQQIFQYLNLLEHGCIQEGIVNEIVLFLNDKLNITLADNFGFKPMDEKITFLIQKLNRPMRICGMVKNEGEPGGGPFWVMDQSGQLSLQIVESSQVDMDNATQAEIIKESTYFNPVDLVCAIKNYKNIKFDLPEFVDYNSGFIVEKNVGGKPIKGYELPGLWNGAMAHWLTVFVEVPVLTFNPVKTVNDLLKPAHQP